MLSVALTGNIGAGKTTVAELFRLWGATIIDADRLVRDVQAPGQPALDRIARRCARKSWPIPTPWLISTESFTPRFTGAGSSCWRKPAPAATGSW
jgi:adenylate kinase family enzyme